MTSRQNGHHGLGSVSQRRENQCLTMYGLQSSRPTCMHLSGSIAYQGYHLNLFLQLSYSPIMEA